MQQGLKVKGYDLQEEAAAKNKGERTPFVAPKERNIHWKEFRVSVPRPLYARLLRSPHRLTNPTTFLANTNISPSTSPSSPPSASSIGTSCAIRPTAAMILLLL